MASIFRSAYDSPDDTREGKRPVVFDVLAPDKETSLLPDGLRMVLHVNPRTMSIKLNREVTRIQTRGGFVEQHWGDSVEGVDFAAATGGFMRLYGGLSNTTSTRFGGSRQETIAYDKYKDMLALFLNNGSVFDASGRVVLQGIIKMSFDGAVWLGWFNDFSVTESSEKPYQFDLSTSFEVDREIQSMRSTLSSTQATYSFRGERWGQAANDPFFQGGG